MTPDPKTFDLRAALAGVSFPTETITVFFDANLMYEYAVATRERDYDIHNEEKTARVEELEAVFKDIAVQVTVKDVPQRIRKDLIKKVRDEFPPTTNMFGIPMDTPEGSEELQTRLWATYITAITGPDGTVVNPTTEDIQALRDNSPDITLNAIKKAIDSLTEDAKTGYEQIVQDPGFLSQPSPMESPDSTTP